MRNAWRIFRDDLRQVGANIVALVVVLGLCLAPALNAWFNIAGSWDPYSNGAQLKVAVVNDDEGYESSLMPVRLNIGDRVVSVLREDSGYGWTFTDGGSAIDGVRSGEYYAAIVIPEDFSEKMMSVFSADVEPTNVDIYVNMKEYPNAPVIADEGGGRAEEGIRAKFSDAVNQMALGLASDLVSFAGGNNAKDFGARLVSHLDDAARDLDDAASQIRAFSNLTGAASSYASSVNQALQGSDEVSGAVGKTLSTATEALDAAIGQAQSAAADVQQQVRSAKDAGGLSEVGTDQASTLAADVSTLAGSVDSIRNETQAVIDSLSGATKGLSDPDASVIRNLNDTRNQLGISANKLNAASSKVRKFEEDVASAIARGELDDVAAIVGGSETAVAQWLAEPITVQQHAAYPMGDFGSFAAPFFMVLALWAGVVVLVLVVGTRVPADRLARYEEEGGRPVRGFEQYLGRYLVFLLVALLQAATAALGALFFLHVQCANPLCFLAACGVCSLAFSSVAYLLAASFGNMGKVMCIALLLLALVGIGGEYPAQMLGDVFRVVSPFLPFTPAVHALQLAVAGVYDAGFGFDLLRLAAFLFGALFLGLALCRPLARFGDFYHDKLQGSGLA